MYRIEIPSYGFKFIRVLWTRIYNGPIDKTIEIFTTKILRFIV